MCYLYLKLRVFLKRKVQPKKCAEIGSLLYIYIKTKPKTTTQKKQTLLLIVIKLNKQKKEKPYSSIFFLSLNQ